VAGGWWLVVGGWWLVVSGNRAAGAVGLGLGIDVRQGEGAMKKQPDFAKLFREYFGTTPAKVTYKVRWDSNRRHDLTFLGSLIHDAEFKPKDVVLRGGRLVIPIMRDCWELGMIERPGWLELYSAKSQLVISPAIDFRWVFSGDAAPAWDKDVMIDSVWLLPRDFEAGDSESLVLAGHSWQCQIRLEEDFTVRLQDLEVPHLWDRRRSRA
jgi:hypothetical protein